jgi:hypothetical protein
MGGASVHHDEAMEEEASYLLLFYLLLCHLRLDGHLMVT